MSCPWSTACRRRRTPPARCGSYAVPVGLERRLAQLELTHDVVDDGLDRRIDRDDERMFVIGPRLQLLQLARLQARLPEIAPLPPPPPPPPFLPPLPTNHPSLLS